MSVQNDPKTGWVHTCIIASPYQSHVDRPYAISTCDISTSISPTHGGFVMAMQLMIYDCVLDNIIVEKK